MAAREGSNLRTPFLTVSRLGAVQRQDVGVVEEIARLGCNDRLERGVASANDSDRALGQAAVLEGREVAGLTQWLEGVEDEGKSPMKPLAEMP